MPSRTRRPALVILGVVAGIVALVGVMVAQGDTSSSAGSLVTGSTSSSPGANSQAASAVTGGSGPVTVTTQPVRPSAATAADLPASLPAAGPSVRVPILMYHYVDDQPPTEMGPYAESLTVPTREFEAQAAYLQAQGIETIDFRRLYLALAGSSPLAGRSVLLTFDDGGADLYSKAFPILKSHGLIATFFVITDEIGKPGYLTWEQLAEMRAAGMSIQSHSRSHPDLPSTSDDRLQAELVESKRAIERSVAEVVFVLCYPAGSYDQRVQSAAREAGYLMAVTTEAGKDSSPREPLALPRVRVQPGLDAGGFAEVVK